MRHAARHGFFYETEAVRISSFTSQAPTGEHLLLGVKLPAHCSAKPKWLAKSQRLQLYL